MPNRALPVKLLCILAIVTLSSPVWGAQEMLRLSTSAQIAEAYGNRIVKEFQTMTGIPVQTYVGPTDTALKRVLTGASDLATIDRPLPPEAKAKGFVQIPFCRDTIAVITHPECTTTRACNVDNLTTQQLRAVFSGRITDWSQLGGPEQRIIVFIPNESTGAYQNFKSEALRLNEMRYHFVASDSTIAVEAVRHIRGSITFVAQGAIAGVDNIKIINVDGLSPRDKKYPLVQTYSFVTKGPPDGPAKAAINFGLSKWGIEMMKARGMTPIID